MAKHSIQTTRRTQTRGLLISAALVWGLGISPIWAGQHIVQGSQSGPKPGQPAGQMGSSVPARSAQTPVQSKTTTSGATLGVGKRDPFKLPEVATAKNGGENGPSNAPNAPLVPGIRGLVIPHLVVEGLVREQTSNKMIAVVTNETKRAYFLHENDALYDGVVSKITPDTVIFKENVLDADGRVTTREVTKKLGAAPGEGR